MGTQKVKACVCGGGGGGSGNVSIQCVYMYVCMHAYFRPVARGVQTGAIAPPGCEVRFAGYEYYSLFCAIYTYINKNCHVHDRVHVRALVRDQFGLWVGPFCPRSTLKKDILVCIYPVWIIIYHIESKSVLKYPPPTI